jgi:hypothetical protein
MNRLASKDFADDGVIDVAFTWAATGRRETVADPRGATTYACDELDRLASVTHPDGSMPEHACDSAGNQTLSRAHSPSGAGGP